MSKFTFDDWMNDRIDYKVPGGSNILGLANGLLLLVQKDLLTMQDYNKIKDCQERAFDTAVDLTFKTLVMDFEEAFNRTKNENKTEYINNRIILTQQLLDKDLNLKDQVLRGSKGIYSITGSQYKKIVERESKGGYVAFALNDNMRLSALHKLLKYLEQQIKTTSTPKWKYSDKANLSLRQIALKHFYERSSITRENASKIVCKYGFKSGDKLYQHFCFYSSRANRKAKPETQKQLENKIILFESIEEILPKDKKSQASDEISILKGFLKNEY